MGLQAVIFDLDGVITDTARFHYRAWKAIALREGIDFNEAINERLKGVSRAESLEIILEKAARVYAQEEKAALAQEKNRLYVAMLESITPSDILIGIRKFMAELSRQRIKQGLYSASRNTDRILEKLGMQKAFNAVVTGNDVERTKPDPQGFLLAAHRLRVLPECCVVIEDAFAGLRGARSAGMKAIGIGEADNLTNADLTLPTTESLSLDVIYSCFKT